MSASFSAMVSEAFHGICESYELSLVASSADEVIGVGNEYLLLFWNDREGLSVYYFDLNQPSGPRLVNLSNYLARTRRWIIEESEIQQNDNAVLRRDLLNCARTLAEVAPDILAGDKKWLSESAVAFLPMRDEQFQEILRCVNALKGTKQE